MTGNVASETNKKYVLVHVRTENPSEKLKGKDQSGHLKVDIGKAVPL